MSAAGQEQITRKGLYLCLISIHGLIRGEELELGRDADTGGQTKYVVELARALARHPEVAQVDLLTRQVVDAQVSGDYAEPIEALAANARIIRIEAGPPGYLAKETLWDHLDTFVDNTIAYFHSQPRQPDLLHSHYADAGYVGSRLAHIRGIPLIHTGHSLGRVKRRRLLATGLSSNQIEERYAMARRIEAEELTLASAERVITSTRQEIEEQYALYDYYQAEQMQVIPPGTDLEKFHPPAGDEEKAPIAAEIRRFLQDPDKPMILALSRPDARKNVGALLTAFGEDPQLQKAANLVIVLGNRDDIQNLESGAQEVLTQLLVQIDQYDLYGRVAYPKHHAASEVPLIYRLATRTRGVFVNPALTEPFGLTLIEAAASGLPIVATEDGGPRDIIANCHNGLLTDPLDPQDIAARIGSILFQAARWDEYSRNGITGVEAHYSWDAHVQSYLTMVSAVISSAGTPLFRQRKTRKKRLYHDRAIFSDLDQNLLADPEAIPELARVLRENRNMAYFGIATGRRLDSALEVIRRYGIPEPDFLITSGGTEIHYAPELTEDTAWPQHIDTRWTPQVVRRTLASLPGLWLQKKQDQSRFKISYYIDPDLAPSLEEINQLLAREEQAVNVILSFGQFLDILPIRASKGLALRYIAALRELPLERILACGGSGADEDMMRGNTLAAVVGSRHEEELSHLTDLDRIYFARAPGARGILEAMEHYDFFGRCQPPEEEATQP
ncbi:HAD-IIB family hydrolase [Desulfuromonas carbonis]|uniref:HAD-IIB family hydrolase n=1 Tax=Desulfuromonas sp. DDH964 TaxID=1823759 RepID=UPI00078C4044|nr:HAD-IIB family hydrolase [Desulfuromonas sp. DDH964]AMV72636.1 Mannosylfructose-phosphate synthase [Desulfuromonas sp. DDH964]